MYAWAPRNAFMWGPAWSARPPAAERPRLALSGRLVSYEVPIATAVPQASSISCLDTAPTASSTTGVAPETSTTVEATPPGLRPGVDDVIDVAAQMRPNGFGAGEGRHAAAVRTGPRDGRPQVPGPPAGAPKGPERGPQRSSCRPSPPAASSRRCATPALVARGKKRWTNRAANSGTSRAYLLMSAGSASSKGRGLFRGRPLMRKSRSTGLLVLRRRRQAVKRLGWEGDHSTALKDAHCGPHLRTYPLNDAAACRRRFHLGLTTIYHRC